MAFPQTILSTKVEAVFNNTFVDITPYVYVDDIQITRGSADESSFSQPSKATMRINNRDGRFSPRNPDGPYYGSIGRNTPLLVSVKSGDTFLDVPGNGSASTPDAASLDITGDIDIRFEAALEDWAGIGAPLAQELIGKFNQVGNQRSWLLMVVDGTLRYEWSVAGATTLGASSERFSPDPSGRLAVRVTHDVDNGASGNTVTFYTAPTIDGPWTQLGDQTIQAGTTSIFNSTAPLRVGDALADVAFTTPNGKILAAQVYNGIDGTVVANPDFTIQTVGAGSFVDGAGKTWTINSQASINNQYNRFRGEVVAWPSRWEAGNFDVWVPLEAQSLLRRHNQGKKDLKSTLARRIPTDSTIVGYWPMEDGSGAHQFASGLPDGHAATFTGDIDLAGHPGPDGSDSLPSFNENCSWFGVIPGPSGSVASGFQCEWIVNIQQATSTLRTIMQINTTGTALTWQFQIDTTGINIRAVSRTGAVLVNTPIAITQSEVINHWARWEFTARQNGGNIDWGIQIIPIGGQGGIFTASFAGTVGRASSFQGPPNLHADIAGISMGHFAAFNTATTTTIYNSADLGFAGESAWDRISRLCTEEGEPFELVGARTDTALMGPQRPDKLIDLFQEIADTDRGIFLDSRNGSGFTRFRYVTKGALYNQTPRLVLGYTDDGEVHAPLDPTDDDQKTRNSVTASIQSGSSAIVELETGPLSIEDVGLYDTQVTVNPFSEDELIHHAGWEVHIGTWDEERYPSVLIRMQAAPGLIPDALFVDIGCKIRIQNARDETTRTFIPPGDIDLMVVGYTERLSQYEWEIEFNCIPARPWDVAVNSSLSSNNWLDTDGCEVEEAIDTTETGFTVFTTAGPTWTDDVSDYPFDLTIGGERVTAVAPGGLLNNNPLLLVDGSDWTGQAATAVASTAVVHPDRNANRSVLVTPDGSLATASGISTLSNSGTVNVGAQYTASAWVYSPGGYDSAQLFINWHQSGGAYISTSNGTATAVPSGTWTQLEFTATAPALASRASILVGQSNSPTSTEIFYFWDATLTRLNASWAFDGFGRTLVDSWGQTDTADGYTNAGGTGADFDVTGGKGTHTLATTNVSRRSTIGAPSADLDVRVDVDVSAVATGGSLFGGPMVRVLDSNNLYQARLEFTTGSGLILSIRKRVAGVETELGTFTLTGTYAAGTQFRIRFQAFGTALKSRAWLTGNPEPDVWQIEVTDSSLTGADPLGLRSISAAANTNVNPLVRYDNFELTNPQALVVVRSRDGVVKSHSTGAAISLTYPMYLAL